MNTQKGFSLAQSELVFIGQTTLWVALAGLITGVISIISHGNFGVYTPVALALVPVLQGLVLKFDGKVPVAPPTV